MSLLCILFLSLKMGVTLGVAWLVGGAVPPLCLDAVSSIVF
jgi:hypothetical protein